MSDLSGNPEGRISRDTIHIFQLDNTQGSEEMYRERVDDHLVRCIVQLTIASQDDSLWRSINYQICLKTRSSEPQVYFWGLNLITVWLHD